MTTNNLPVVGFTISNRDGSEIGKWITWMIYFDTEEEAKGKANAHIKFLNERGEDVVLVTLYGSI